MRGVGFPFWWQRRAGAIAAVPNNSNQLCHHSKEHIYRKLRASQFLISKSFKNLSIISLIWATYLWAIGHGQLKYVFLCNIEKERSLCFSEFSGQSWFEFPIVMFMYISRFVGAATCCHIREWRIGTTLPSALLIWAVAIRIIINFDFYYRNVDRYHHWNYQWHNSGQWMAVLIWTMASCTFELLAQQVLQYS